MVGADMPQMGELLRAAADALMGEASATGPAASLLQQLGYRDSTAENRLHRAALLRAAAGFRRIFQLEGADAPGLVAIGAEVDPALIGAEGISVAGVSGIGLSFRQAFESCVGEGVEYLSQCASPADPIALAPENEALAGAHPALAELWARLQPYRRRPENPLTAWARAESLVDGGVVSLPADLCYRRPEAARDITPPWPLSIGCGAGTDATAATAHGLLELVERDAVALWWRGGRRPRLLPADIAEVSELIIRLRGEAIGRRTWLLDVTTDLRVPVVVAASCNDDGLGLACGHAARGTLAAAARAAVLEMTQMELAQRIAAAKRESLGEAALNEADRQHIHRFTRIDVARTPALHPTAPPAPPCDLTAGDGATLVAQLLGRLQAAGLVPYVLDITRPTLGIPVRRTLCPGLEAGMSAPPGPRLRAVAAEHGIDPACALPM